MVSLTSGMRRKIGSAQPGPSTSIVEPGSRCLRSVSRGCDSNASPIHDGATIRILVMVAKANSHRRGAETQRKRREKPGLVKNWNAGWTDRECGRYNGHGGTGNGPATDLLPHSTSWLSSASIFSAPLR